MEAKNVETLPAPIDNRIVIINPKNKKVFHEEGCSMVTRTKNIQKMPFNEAVSKGFKTCATCCKKREKPAESSNLEKAEDQIIEDPEVNKETLTSIPIPAFSSFEEFNQSANTLPETPALSDSAESDNSLLPPLHYTGNDDEEDQKTSTSEFSELKKGIFAEGEVISLTADLVSESPEQKEPEYFEVDPKVVEELDLDDDDEADQEDDADGDVDDDFKLDLDIDDSDDEEDDGDSEDDHNIEPNNIKMDEDDPEYEDSDLDRKGDEYREDTWNEEDEEIGKPATVREISSFSRPDDSQKQINNMQIIKEEKKTVPNKDETIDRIPTFMGGAPKKEQKESNKETTINPPPISQSKGETMRPNPVNDKKRKMIVRMKKAIITLVLILIILAGGISAMKLLPGFESTIFSIFQPAIPAGLTPRSNDDQKVVPQTTSFKKVVNIAFTTSATATVPEMIIERIDGKADEVTFYITLSNKTEKALPVSIDRNRSYLSEGDRKIFPDEFQGKALQFITGSNMYNIQAGVKLQGTVFFKEKVDFSKDVSLVILDLAGNSYTAKIKLQ